MTVDAGLVTWLVLGSLVLAALAVVLDRVNFPQRPFRPKRIEVGPDGVSRDRTGAHIVNDEDDQPNGTDGTGPGASDPGPAGGLPQP